jgi:RNA polymerase sigma factor (sigma-70 family)
LLSARFRLFLRQRLKERSDIEEVAQEALKTIFEKYRQIDFQTSFLGWAYKVLNNKLLTISSTRGRHKKKLEQLSEQQSLRQTREPRSDLEAKLLDCLRMVNKANPRHARVLNLHYQGYSADEICSRLGLTRTNLYTVLSRARTMLWACLEKRETK